MRPLEFDKDLIRHSVGQPLAMRKINYLIGCAVDHKQRYGGQIVYVSVRIKSGWQRTGG